MHKFYKDEEVFEIVDFTSASEWYVTEKILSKTGSTLSCIILGKFLLQNWKKFFFPGSFR